MIRIMTAGFSACMLAACGGGSDFDPTAPVDPTTRSRNTPIPSVQPGFPVGSYLVNYGGGGVGNTLLLGNPDLDFGEFDFAGLTADQMVFRAETDEARVTLSRNVIDATGVRFERLTSTNLPMGEVLYAGDYVAIVSNTDTGNIVYLINGDARLNVDFALGELSGSIIERTVLGPSGDPAIGVTSADVVLSNGSLNSQGVFSGETSGGSIFALSTTTAQTGTFDGLIAGAEGDQAVGGLDFIHARTGVDYHEEGAFFVDEAMLIASPTP